MFLTPSELEDAKVYYSSLFYEYPEDRGTYNMWWWTLMRVMTDHIPGFGRCSSRALGDALMRADPSAAVYEAHFVRPVDDHSDWCFTEECDSARNDGVHAVHYMDVEYVFEHPEAPEARELSDAVELYWTAFAKSGGPPLPETGAYSCACTGKPCTDFCKLSMSSAMICPFRSGSRHASRGILRVRSPFFKGSAKRGSRRSIS